MMDIELLIAQLVFGVAIAWFGMLLNFIEENANDCDTITKRPEPPEERIPNGGYQESRETKLISRGTIQQSPSSHARNYSRRCYYSPGWSRNKDYKKTW